MLRSLRRSPKLVAVLVLTFVVGIGVGALGMRESSRLSECGRLSVPQVVAVRNAVMGYSFQSQADDGGVVDDQLEPCLNGGIYYRSVFKASEHEAISEWFEKLTQDGWKRNERADGVCAEREVDGIVIGLEIRDDSGETVVAAAARPGDDSPCLRGVDYYA